MSIAFQAGQRVRLLQDWPAIDPRPDLHLPVGLEGLVREVVPAATPGAHNAEEDCVVVEFPQDGGFRAVAFGESQIAVLELAE